MLPYISFEIRGILNVLSSKHTRPAEHLLARIALISFCITISRGRCAVLFSFRCEQKAVSNYPLLESARTLPTERRVACAAPARREFIEPAGVTANSCSHLARFAQLPFFLFSSPFFLRSRTSTISRFVSRLGHADPREGRRRRFSREVRGQAEGRSGRVG